MPAVENAMCRSNRLHGQLTQDATQSAASTVWLRKSPRKSTSKQSARARLPWPCKAVERVCFDGDYMVALPMPTDKQQLKAKAPRNAQAPPKVPDPSRKSVWGK